MDAALSCNICGDKSYIVLYPQQTAQIHQIVRCRTCGLMYANPREPVDLDGIELMDPAWLLNNLHEPWIRTRIEKERLQVRDFEDTLLFLKTRFPRAGKLLEVGSSYGFLSNFFRESGWSVAGIDPDRGACAYAKSRFRLDVTPLSLDKAAIPENSADVVLMLHVLEHLADPKESLARIHRILRPGGVLVLETPRYDTLMFRCLGRRERSISCGGHIYFFTSDSLKRLARQSGFQLLRLDYVGRSLTLERVLFNVGVMLKNGALAGKLEGLSRSLRLERFRVHWNLRDMQRIYLQK